MSGPVEGAAGARIDALLKVVLEKKASDLHLACGSPPMIRVDGDLTHLRWRSIREEDFENLLHPITPAWVWEEWSKSGDGDFAYSMGDKARFRVNLFRQEHGPGAVLRMIPPRVLTVEDLGLPRIGRRRREDAPRPRPGHRADRLGEVDDSRRPHRPDQPDEGVPHHHDRGPGRVRPRLEDVDHDPPGARARHPDLDGRPEGCASGGSRRGSRRRAARHRDDADGAPRRRDRAPRLRHAPHELRRQGGRPPDRRLPARRAGAGAHRSLRGPQGGRRPAPPQEERGRAVPAFEVLRGSAALANAIREGKTATITSLIQTGRSHGMVGMDQYLAELVFQDLVDTDEAADKAVDKEYFKSLVEKRRAGEIK